MLDLLISFSTAETSLDQARVQKTDRQCDVLAFDVSTELGIDSPMYRQSQSNPIDSLQPT